MKKRDNIIRIGAIAVLYIAISLLYVGRLLYLQVSGQDYYSMSTPTRTYSRTVKLQAQRGEIFDRNGNALVSNNYSYNIALDYASLPVGEKESNDIIISLVDAARILGIPECVIEPKESLIVTAVDGVGLTYSMSDGFLETSRGRKYTKLLAELNVDEDASIEEQAEALLLHYGIAAWDKETDSLSYHYTYDSCAFLLELRLDMDFSGFSSVSPYTLIKGAPLELLTVAEESCPRGILIQMAAERVYNYPGYASHILGRVGKISDKQLLYYTERGYPMDAIVGLDGVEQAFEDYLRGIDGEMKITEDSYGNILSAEVTKNPVAGHDVYLTIDIEMQMVAEKGLAENIFKIREEAKWSGPLHGEDASAGAMTVLDVDTGEILAICSYPTYNLATFSEDWDIISTDENKPLYNRALSGYAPGSTFKVGVSVAALEEGIIEKNTYINAQGMYMYYADSGYTPRCWLYLLSGRSHGPINVVEAIQESCNYFFYDVGRRLTIEKMNEYCKHFGLGEPTGIELSEKTGILAGPDYRAENGLNQWSPGDTLQAAIGQSDNLFTPLQLSTYLSTILNGGTRYSAHLLYQVRSYGGERILYQNEPKVVSEIEITDDHLETVREGMRGVMDNGSAASVFSGYAIPVGGKTGTAQVSDTKSDNGIMTAFAPFDDPEIVISCVIEQGSGGTEAGYSVRDVFDYYFREEIAALADAASEPWYDAYEDYEDWGGR